METWKIIALTLIPLIMFSIIWDKWNLNEIRKNGESEETRKKTLISSHSGVSLKYWCDVDVKEGIKPYESINTVLDYMGHTRIEMEIGKRPTTVIRHYNWDLLYTWQHFSQTKIQIDFSKLKQHHRINHFPGITSVTNIDFLATSIQSPYIPPVFTNHEDIQNYIRENNSKAKFVEKASLNSSHVKYVEDPNNIDFDDGKNFAQVLIENPLLVNGSKFEFGIYVVLTSVNPLRAYYYTGNVLLRVADEEFDSSDFSDPKTFTVTFPNAGGDFAEFDKYREKKYSEMDILKVILKEREIDPNVVFDQVEDAINSILTSQENIIASSVQDTNTKFGKENFFEILRFDFYLDENSQLYLSEAVLSPILHRTSDIGMADLGESIYRSVLYNTFNLIGIGSYLKTPKVRDLGKYYVEFLANDNQINVNPEICINPPCSTSCEADQCKVCMRCMDSETHHDFKLAYLEHLNMGDMKRVSPRSNVSNEN